MACGFWSLNEIDLLVPLPIIVSVGYMITLLSCASKQKLRICSCWVVHISKSADRYDLVWLALLVFYFSTGVLYWLLTVPVPLPPGCAYVEGEAFNVAFESRCLACCSCLFHQGSSSAHSCTYHRCGPFNYTPSYQKETWPRHLLPLAPVPSPGRQPYCWYDNIGRDVKKASEEADKSDINRHLNCMDYLGNEMMLGETDPTDDYPKCLPEWGCQYNGDTNKNHTMFPKKCTIVCKDNTGVPGASGFGNKKFEKPARSSSLLYDKQNMLVKGLQRVLEDKYNGESARYSRELQPNVDPVLAAMLQFCLFWDCLIVFAYAFCGYSRPVVKLKLGTRVYVTGGHHVGLFHRRRGAVVEMPDEFGMQMYQIKFDVDNEREAEKDDFRDEPGKSFGVSLHNLQIDMQRELPKMWLRFLTRRVRATEALLVQARETEEIAQISSQKKKKRAAIGAKIVVSTEADVTVEIEVQEETQQRGQDALELGVDGNKDVGLLPVDAEEVQSEESAEGNVSTREVQERQRRGSSRQSGRSGMTLPAAFSSIGFPQWAMGKGQRWFWRSLLKLSLRLLARLGGPRSSMLFADSIGSNDSGDSGAALISTSSLSSWTSAAAGLRKKRAEKEKGRGNLAEVKQTINSRAKNLTKRELARCLDSSDVAEAAQEFQKQEQLVPVQRQTANFNLLHWASRNGHLDAVQLLLKKRADVNAQVTSDSENDRQQNRGKENSSGYEGATALWLACANGKGAVVRELLQHSADDTLEDSASGSSPLLIAAQYNFVECVRLLLKHRADPDAADHTGLTPLYWATLYNSTGVMALLINAGARKAGCDIVAAELAEEAYEGGTRTTEVKAFDNAQGNSMHLLHAGLNKSTLSSWDEEHAATMVLQKAMRVKSARRDVRSRKAHKNISTIARGERMWQELETALAENHTQRQRGSRFYKHDIEELANAMVDHYEKRTKPYGGQKSKLVAEAEEYLKCRQADTETTDLEQAREEGGAHIDDDDAMFLQVLDLNPEDDHFRVHQNDNPPYNDLPPLKTSKTITKHKDYPPKNVKSNDSSESSDEEEHKEEKHRRNTKRRNTKRRNTMMKKTDLAVSQIQIQIRIQKVIQKVKALPWDAIQVLAVKKTTNRESFCFVNVRTVAILSERSLSRKKCTKQV